MKILLKQDIESLGNVGDVVNVKNGFARNYLIPQGMAIEATERNLKAFQETHKLSTLRMAKEKRTAEAMAQELAKVSVTATVQVGEEDRVFGAVTSQNIADLLTDKGYEIDRRRILLDEPLKALGVYDIGIKLHSEVEAKIKVWVVKE